MLTEGLRLTAKTLGALRAEYGVERAASLADVEPAAEVSDEERGLRRALAIADHPDLATFRAAGSLTLAAGDGSEPLRFTGHPTTFGTLFAISPYWPELQQFIDPAAFDGSLADDPSVVFLFDHAGLPMSHTKATDAACLLSLGTDDEGLTFDARAPRSDAYAMDIAARVAAGVLTEMSISVLIVNYEWMPPLYLIRKLTELDIDRGDVSVVRYGLNPVTDVAVKYSADVAEGSDESPETRVDLSCLEASAESDDPPTTLTLPDGWPTNLAELELLEAS